jgi:D-beta-D-heptose 7-phosphate kinase/D-beta-D-heptose 1-phosphate adenosyltransferase
MKKFSDINIAVIGDIMLDKYIYGHVDSVSQEAPVPVVQVDKKENILGGAGNVAKNLFNLHVNLYGVRGVDDHGTELLQTLGLFEHHDHPIRYRLSDTYNLTTTKMRIIAGHQQIGRIDFEEIKDISEEVEKEIIYDIKNSDKYDIIVISDYGKGICTPNLCQKIIKIAKEKEITVIVDPKGSDWEKYRGANIVIPNLKELYEPPHLPSHETSIENMGRFLKSNFQIENILITRAEKGMTLINHRNTIRHIPTEAQEVYDVCGAGDTVVAVLAALLARCLPIESAIKYANRAAGKVIQKLGTVPIEYDEMQEIMEQMTDEDQNQLC